MTGRFRDQREVFMFRQLLPGGRPRVLSLVSVLLAGALLFGVKSVDAQQFVVDDAGITDPGACQLEGWIGEAAGWILPACTPIGRAEITLGVGYADEAHGGHAHRHTEFVAQAKVNIVPDDPGVFGASVVAGFGFGPFAQATGTSVEELFAYVPVTWTHPGERAFLHLNGGWAYETEASAHRALYGVRGDLVVHDRLTVIGELFGEGEDVGAQGGLRVSLVPDFLLLDATWGVGVAGDTPDIGFALGIALTPRAFFTPIR